MASPTLSERIHNKVSRLSPDQQRKVYDFISSMDRPLPRGTSGNDLLQFLGIIGPEEMERIESAIEEGCERVDDSW